MVETDSIVPEQLINAIEDALQQWDRTPAPLAVVIPVYNDWSSVIPLIEHLDGKLREHNREIDLFLLDDASSQPFDATSLSDDLTAIRCIQHLRLRRNLGHQRAIAIGLAHLAQQHNYDAVIVMDGDGEDSPADVESLLKKSESERHRKIVFAERTKRSETLWFRIGYCFFRLLHWMLTGRGCRVGNFSVIPRERLESLVVVTELWNHYAASAFASRQPYTTVPTERAKRLDGKSHMNFVGLVTHGLSAISVYAETVGVRLLCTSLLLMVFALAGSIGIFLFRAGAATFAPAWTTTAVSAIAVILAQAIMFLLLFSFVVLAGRNASTFLPLRDYHHFVKSVAVVHVAKTDSRKQNPILVPQ